MIRVLIVEDSPVEQELLRHLLDADPQLEVVGVAGDGEQAIAEVARLQPDLVTMDIHMPRLNGFDTTRRIMEQHPVPIVIVSGSFSRRDLDKTFRAMEAGALALVRKPRGIGHPAHQQDVRELLDTVKAMAEVTVIRRWPPQRREVSPPQPLPAPPRKAEALSVIAIGASTGGPTTLRQILELLPSDLPVPLLVVQHMAKGFTTGLADWLAATTGLSVHLARNGETPLPGHVYLAPDNVHLQLGPDRRLRLCADPPENGLRPAVASLFRSVAASCGPHAMGILLTGMGRDGAAELGDIRRQGGVTVAQDEGSAIVFGMPGEAVRIGAAEFVLPPGRIAQLICRLTRKPESQEGRPS